MKKSGFLTKEIIVVSLATFAMFFGAGNLVFPLHLGQIAGDKNFYAIAGLVFTAVVLPVVGLITMVLFQSHYKDFFYRIGRIPGFMLIILSMVLIGPLIVIPRCITLTYSLFEYSLHSVGPLWLFSLISCAIIFGFCIYRGKIIDIFGYVLTPILLLFLVIIIIKGFMLGPPAHRVEMHDFTAFLEGLQQGYNTLDLLAGLFFPSLVFASIQEKYKNNGNSGANTFVIIALKAGLIAGGLLALIYIGMSYAIAFHGEHELITVAHPDQLIAAISSVVLGGYSGLAVTIVAALACLTTAVSLAIIFAEFLSKTFSTRAIKLSYLHCVLMTVVVTFMMSLLGFAGIAKIVVPIIVVIYPTYIALTLFNLAYKLYGVKIIKVPVALTFLISVIVSYAY